VIVALAALSFVLLIQYVGWPSRDNCTMVSMSPSSSRIHGGDDDDDHDDDRSWPVGTWLKLDSSDGGRCL
jgi:hypothetical protein